MAGKDRTLAVSNGAFTCRLEGFDRPADIVRLIDRYLRQKSGALNQDAGHPTPQVLAKIVGRSIGARVRASTRNGVTVLSPSAVSPPKGHPPASGAVAVARAFKVKRTDFETAVAKGRIEEVTDASVSPTGGVAGHSAATGRQARALLTEQQVGDDTHGNLSRLISKTNDEMGKAGGSQGRTAIGHLRAAVAATKAGLGLSGTSGSDMREQEKHYRQDLAKEVRTRSVTTPPDDMVRPPDPPARHAKLVLEVEQRIDPPDRTAPPPDDLAQPPALSASEPSQQTTDHIDQATSFPAFVRAVNAINLPDLMEAAAAYLTFVEGRARFSRRHLMSRLRKIKHADYNRADRLQCLSRLLERDKIRQVDRGVFEVTDRNRYAPITRKNS